MAIAVNGGHINRALDFYNSEGKYFIIGGTEPWNNVADGGGDTPPSPSVDDYKLNSILGLKRVDNTYMVIPTEETENVITYRNQNWKRVIAYVSAKIGEPGVPNGSNIIVVDKLDGITVGSKLRIANTYEGVVESIEGLNVTLNTTAPSDIPAGSEVLGGAMVEGAKYVYVDCYLNYDKFPLGTPKAYRQIGLCTGVIVSDTVNVDDPEFEGVLRPAGVDGVVVDEFASLGTLEIIDNRLPSTRDISQRELLSLIIEF